MAAPYCFIDYKLERAVVAYLISKSVGTVTDTFPSLSVGARTYPLTTVMAVNGQEDPDWTGNTRITLWVSVKGSASQDANAADIQAQIKAFYQRVASVWDALRQTSNGNDLSATALDITTVGRATAVAVDGSAAAIKFAADNADMVDFTVLQWAAIGFGQPKADEGGNAWERILQFTVLCCPKNVD